MNPFDSSQSRIPFQFELDKNRVNKSPTNSGLASGNGVYWNLYQYFPPNKDTTYAPYLYFKAVAGQYGFVSGTSIRYASWTQPNNGAKITAYKDSKSNYAPPPYNPSGNKTYAWINPTGYQLLCPGLDGWYGGSNKTGTGPNGNDTAERLRHLRSVVSGRHKLRQSAAGVYHRRHVELHPKGDHRRQRGVVRDAAWRRQRHENDN